MKYIIRWTIALVLMSSILGAHAQVNDGHLFTLSRNDYQTVFAQGLPVPAGDPNVFRLLTNHQCGLNGFLTLHTSLSGLISTAGALSRRTSRLVFIFQVRSTANMRSMWKSALANRGQISSELISELINLAMLDDRWITPDAVAREDIRGAFEVRGHISGAEIIFHYNPHSIRRFAEISAEPFIMPPQPAAISNQYIRLALLEYANRTVNAYTVHSFTCIAPRRTLLSTSFSNGCVTEDDFIELHPRLVLARKLLPILRIRDD